MNKVRKVVKRELLVDRVLLVKVVVHREPNARDGVHQVGERDVIRTIGATSAKLATCHVFRIHCIDKRARHAVDAYRVQNPSVGSQRLQVPCALWPKIVGPQKMSLCVPIVCFQQRNQVVAENVHVVVNVTEPIELGILKSTLVEELNLVLGFAAQRGSRVGVRTARSNNVTARQMPQSRVVLVGDKPSLVCCYPKPRVSNPSYSACLHQVVL
jgi:hypothetical protein